MIRVPLPAESEPLITINSLSVSATPVPEHSHRSPVIAFVVRGEIENQVEPEPAAVYGPGGYFYEAPGRRHQTLRSLHATAPAVLLIMSAGPTGVPASLVKPLGDDEPVPLLRFRFGDATQPAPAQFQVPLTSTREQELVLLRLTLPAGGDSAAPTG